MEKKFSVFTAPLVLLAVVFILYSVSLGHNFLFDEESIVIYNPWIRQLSLWPHLFSTGYFYRDSFTHASWTQYYRPLTALTFALDYRLWRLNPLGYNLTNVFLHSVVCLLLFGLLRRIVGRQATAAAFLSCLFFAVHTMHTEAVTYIASRGDLLGAALTLLCLHAYWRGRWWLAVPAAAAALFAKESSVLIPAYIFLLDRSFVKSRPLELMRRLFPFLALAASFVIYRAKFCPIPSPPWDGFRPMFWRVLSMGAPLLSYGRALFLPETFKFGEAIRFVSRIHDPGVGVTVCVFFLLAAALLWTLRKPGPGFFGLGMFLVALMPYMQCVPICPQWSEHYLYFPMIGLCVLSAVGIHRIFSARHKAAKIIFLALAIPFFIFLCARTYERNQIYNDTLRYYQILLKSKSPFAAFGYEQSARILMREGNFAGAMGLLKQAEKLPTRSDFTYDLLAICSMKQGLLTEAYDYFMKAYEISERHEFKHLRNAGLILARLGRAAEAVRVFEEIQRQLPHYPRIYIDLMAGCELAGNAARAREWIEKGIAVTAGRPEESAMMLMTAARLAYRQGWDAELKGRLRTLAEGSEGVFWYGDVARLLSGRLSAEQFERIAKNKYAGLDEERTRFELMAAVIKRQAGRVRRLLKENGADLEKLASDDLLIRQELDVAKKFIASQPDLKL